MSFAGDLQRFSSKTKIKLDTVVKKVCIDMTTQLVAATPVDTGMARSNWFLGDSRLTSTSAASDKRGAVSAQRAQQYASTLKAGGVFYIVNNMPYILKLEFGGYKGPSSKVTGSGFSMQAPAGMARITVDRIVRELR